jgi:imidazoleglycerol phosphate dehydratase HisB
MITNQKIEVGDVEYSKLSHVIKFTVAANSDAIRTIEDIVGRNDMSMEEIAKEMGKALEQAIRMGYTRGGMRRRFE